MRSLFIVLVRLTRPQSYSHVTRTAGAGGDGKEVVSVKEVLSGALARSGAPWLSKSTHPRKFGNHVTD